MERRTFLQTAAALTTLGGLEARAAEEWPGGVLDVVGSDPQTGASQAVVVGDVPLVHTEQFGLTRLFESPGDLEAEVFQALERAGARQDGVVKYNFYVAHVDLVKVVSEWLAKRYPSTFKPAVSFVVARQNGGAMPSERAIAVDCIAVRGKPIDPGKVLRVDGAAVLPPTNKLYVSGDAVPGTLMNVVAETLASLEKTLTYCRLNWSHVVQLKTFLQPIELVNDVRREIQTCFGDRPVPVLSFVEWKSSEKIPIEIELIAAVPPELGNKNGEPVEYLTPPNMTASPVFSRAVRTSSDQTIYVSNVYGNSSDPSGQVRDIYSKLQRTLEPLNSDLRHLVKGTYYVTDDVVSKAFGDIRKEIYDPARPPAASKALVLGTGQPERSLTLDMIAVPKRR